MDSPFLDANGEALPFDKVEYNHLIQLVNFEEGWKFEYKGTYDKSVQRKLSKSICSFANCAGGWMFIGIENNTHNIVDIEKPKGEIELNIINAIKPFVDLEVPNLLRAKFIENPTKANYGVIMIGVQEGLHPPYVSNGAIYVRAGAQSDPVSAERATIDYLYKKSDRTSILVLKSINKSVLPTFSMQYVPEHLDFVNNFNVALHEIENIISQCNALLPSTEKNSPSMNLSQNEKTNETINALKLAMTMAEFGRGKELNIDKFLEKEISFITEFIKGFSIDCNLNNLFSFGNLKIYRHTITHQITIEGTDEEKARYQNILDLKQKIELLCTMMPLIKVSDFVYRVDLAIANEGNYYDEDIVLSLQIPKNSFFNFAELNIYSGANEYNQTLLKTTKQRSLPIVDDYDNYSFRKPIIPSMGMDALLYKMVENKAETIKQECERELEYLYNPFEVINYDEEYDILKIRFNKLNPNQIKSLPAPLFFNCELKEIQYSIVSKYSTQKIQQSLKRQ